MSALKRYPWPSSVRELQNLIERVVVLPDRCCVPVEERRLAPQQCRINNRRSHGTLADAERAHTLAVLKETDWVLAGANGAAARRSTLGTPLGGCRLVGKLNIWSCPGARTEIGVSISAAIAYQKPVGRSVSGCFRTKVD